MTMAKKAAKTSAVKENVKETAKEVAPVVKETVKEAAATVKAVAAEAKEAVKKAPAKKPAAKRTTAKKAVEPKMEVHFQFAGKDILAKSVLDQAVEAYKSTHKDVEIKKVELYIVAEEGAAYYVVNGEASDDFKGYAVIEKSFRTEIMKKRLVGG